MDARRLYAREATPSMFTYCTEVLHLSEAEAWLRILVARATREHPVLLAMLRDGRLHLSGIRRLAPHLTPENRGELLRRAVHKSRRQIEELVAEVVPRPDVPDSMRRLPTRRVVAVPAVPAVPVQAADGSGGQAASAPALQLGPDPVADRPGAVPARPARVEPLAPARYKVEFTASAELHDKLQHLQALLRTSVPDGDLPTLIDLAVTEKIERLEAQRFARTKNPRKSLTETDTTPSTRRIPAPVRRAVHERDEGRCTYVDVHGRRCSAREKLEFHHRRPFGRGGDHSPENLALTCRTHNALLAELAFGKKRMARHRRPVRSGGRAQDPTTERVEPPARLEAGASRSDSNRRRTRSTIHPAPTARGSGP